jgi:gamma-glutamylcyclotransferase
MRLGPLAYLACYVCRLVAPPDGVAQWKASLRSQEGSLQLPPGPMDSQEDSQPSQGSVMTLTDEYRREVLYFAYGSNLSTAQMRQRCPHSTPVGLALLEGWRWIINERGFANVVRLPADREGAASEGEGVYGLVYLLPADDEEQLDRYEGVPWAYQKFQADVRRVRDEGGRETDEALRVLVYVDEEGTAVGAPRTEYVDRMERGIRDAVENWGMSEEYANRTMRRFWSY